MGNPYAKIASYEGRVPCRFGCEPDCCCAKYDGVEDIPTAVGIYWWRRVLRLDFYDGELERERVRLYNRYVRYREFSDYMPPGKPQLFLRIGGRVAVQYENVRGCNRAWDFADALEVISE